VDYCWTLNKALIVVHGTYVTLQDGWYNLIKLKVQETYNPCSSCCTGHNICPFRPLVRKLYIIGSVKHYNINKSGLYVIWIMHRDKDEHFIALGYRNIHTDFYLDLNIVLCCVESGLNTSPPIRHITTLNQSKLLQREMLQELSLPSLPST